MPVPKRSAKPRLTGLTMVEGDYMCAVAGMNWLTDLGMGRRLHRLLQSRPPDDVSTQRSRISESSELLKEHEISPYIGGNTTEAVIKQRPSR